MPFGTITATESTFGSISGSIVGAVPGTLSGSVGVPGPQGPVGPAGPQGPQGVPGVGGTWGSIVGTLSAQTDLQTALDGKYSTSNPSGFITASALSPYLTTATANATFQTLAGMSSYLTTSAAAAGYYPLTGNPSSFLTASALTGYATQSFVAANYAPIAAGLPTGGTVGQVLTKNSGTNLDVSFQTLIPGDRYLTTSSTSNSVSNGTKTFTVGTGLSYSSQQDVVISFDASNHMHALVTSYNSGTGVLVVDVQNHTGSGTYTAWTINVGGTTPLQSVEWGEILGTIGDQTDLATALNAKLESSTAASTYAALAGATFTGEVITPASTTSNAGLTITPGVAPSAPQNGEIWATTNDLQVRLNGVTETVAEQSWVTAGFYPLSGNPSGFLTSSALTPYALLSGATFTGLISTPAVTTASAFLRLPHGTAPTTPTNGDVWTTTTALQVRINGSTQNIPSTGGSNTFSGTNTFSGATVSFGTSTAASTINVGTGATLTATTKAINIGTAGVSGSTTNIAIGSATSTTTTTVEGTVTLNGTTLNLGNSTAASQVNLGSGGTISGATKTISIGNNGASGSTTNVGIASSISPPSAGGTITIGTSGQTTTTLQGTTNGVTAAADTNSTVVATTAFVVGQAGSATPLVNGTAAVGTSLRYARADHVHPTDTTRAPLASPAFTGTPSLPTGTTAVTQTAGNNTTAVATTAFVTAAVPAAATVAEAKAGTDTAKFISSNVLQKVVNSPSYYKFPRGIMSTAVSGTGSYVQAGALQTLLGGTSSGAGGAIHRYVGPSSVDIGSGTGWTVGTTYGINFGKQFRLTGSARMLLGANNTVRVCYGKSGTQTVGDPTQASIGWRYVQTTGFIEIIAHNGTSLVTLTTSSSPIPGYFEWELHNNGSGSVQMFVNDVSIGTLTGGPTGAFGNANQSYVEEIESTSSNTIASGVYFRNGGLFLQP